MKQIVSAMYVQKTNFGLRTVCKSCCEAMHDQLKIRLHDILILFFQLTTVNLTQLTIACELKAEKKVKSATLCLCLWQLVKRRIFVAFKLLTAV